MLPLLMLAPIPHSVLAGIVNAYVHCLGLLALLVFIVVLQSAAWPLPAYHMPACIVCACMGYCGCMSSACLSVQEPACGA